MLETILNIVNITTPIFIIVLTLHYGKTYSNGNLIAYN